MHPRGLSRSCVRLAVLLFLFVGGPARAQFTINGKLKVEGGGLDGAQVVVYRNGEKQRVLNNNLGKFSLDLEVNQDYTLSFEKEGFVTKKLSFNTRAPAEAVANGFTPFDFGVSLFKQYDGVNTVVFNQPVGMIRFNREMDDFDYDTDYTKSIQSALEKVEEEVAVKQVEEKKGGGEEKKKAADAERARVKAEAEAKRQAEEQARKEAEAKRKEEAALAKKSEPPPAPKAEPKPAPKPKVQPKPVPPPVVAKAAPPQPKPAPKPVRNYTMAKANEGANTRRSAAPILQEEPSRVQPAKANLAEEPRPKFTSTGPVIIRNEELIVEKTQVITLIRLDDGENITEYKKVVRKYSGTFYFKNGRSCSKVIYDNEALAENR
ncbi:MAG TPA: hypothetical protein VGE21_08285 [Flavobacteriales bacterium]